MIFKTFKEIRDAIIGFIRSDIGSNFNLSDSEPGGQLLNIASDQLSEVNDTFIDVYNANTILAEGQDLDIQAIRQGTQRIKASEARIFDFKIVISGACDISTDDKFQNDFGFQFAPVEDYSFAAAGTERIDIIAVIPGSVEILEGDVNIIVSPISNLDSVENDSTSIFQNGRDIETDTELRTRLDNSTYGTKYVKNAVKIALEKLDYVARATPIEDDINNTIEMIVEQSDLSDDAKLEVCENIAFHKAGGILAISSATGSNKVEKTIEIGEKSTVKIQYSIPEDLPIFARLTLDPVLTAEEQSSLSDYIEAWSNNLLAGQDVIVNGTISVNTAISDWPGKEFTSIGVEISKNSSVFGTDNIEVSILEIAKIPAANVSFI